MAQGLAQHGRGIAALIVYLVATAGSAVACIYEYGITGDFNYAYQGANWSQTVPACGGSKQSPIFLDILPKGTASYTMPPVAPAAQAKFSYGPVCSDDKTKLTVVNNGHTVMLSWEKGSYLANEVKIPVYIPKGGSKSQIKVTSILSANTTFPTGSIQYVKAVPAQLHFHSRSEHSLDGALFASEVHIVHFVYEDQLPACGKDGCIAVLGVMLAEDTFPDTSNTALGQLLPLAPSKEKGKYPVPKGTCIDIGSFLPAIRSYVTYEGSLTAPPCIEGLLWHVMTHPITMSHKQAVKLNTLMGDKYCPGEGGFSSAKCGNLPSAHNWRELQPLNNRIVKAAV